MEHLVNKRITDFKHCRGRQRLVRNENSQNGKMASWCIYDKNDENRKRKMSCGGTWSSEPQGMAPLNVDVSLTSPLPWQTGRHQRLGSLLCKAARHGQQSQSVEENCDADKDKIQPLVKSYFHSKQIFG